MTADSKLLTRTKRETLILEAVLNVTTRLDRLLIEIDSRIHGSEFVEGCRLSAVARIRNEYRRLRQKKGKKAE